MLSQLCSTLTTKQLTTPIQMDYPGLEGVFGLDVMAYNMCDSGLVLDGTAEACVHHC
jgi:hypothetical protein